jgi:hypothetical protein
MDNPVPAIVSPSLRLVNHRAVIFAYWITDGGTTGPKVPSRYDMEEPHQHRARHSRTKMQRRMALLVCRIGRVLYPGLD